MVGTWVDALSSEVSRRHWMLRGLWVKMLGNDALFRLLG